MSKRGLRVLEAIALLYREAIAEVVCAHDHAVQKDYYNDIVACCQSNGIKHTDRADFKEISTPFSMAVSWRWMLHTDNSQLVVMHDSLLPKYRGFNPIVTALLAGDNRVGVTALLAADEVDAGPIVGQKSVRIEYPVKVAAVIDMLISCYIELATDIVEAVVSERPLAGTPQTDSECSFSLWRDGQDYFIDWSQSASYIQRFIDAVGFPYLGAAALLNGREVRILDAETVSDQNIVNRVPGKVISLDNGRPIVVCGTGLLMLKSVACSNSGASILPLRKLRSRFSNPN